MFEQFGHKINQIALFVRFESSQFFEMFGENSVQDLNEQFHVLGIGYPSRQRPPSLQLLRALWYLHHIVHRS